jgi:hypothetical protein
LEDLIPVHTSEPFVSFDIVWTIFGASQAYVSICTEKTFYQISCFWLNVRREFVVTVHNLLVDTKRVIIVKGWITCKHLENEDTKCPPVNELIVAL